MLSNVSTVVTGIVSALGSVLSYAGDDAAEIAAILAIPVIGGVAALIVRTVKRSR